MLIDWDNLPPEHDNRSGRLNINLLNILGGRRPKNMPRPIWIGLGHWRSICAVLSVACLLFLISYKAHDYGLIRLPLPQPIVNDIPDAIYSASMLLIMFIVLAPEKLIKRYLRRVEKHNGEICLTCGYILHGLPPHHRCPECGTEYSLDETRETWRKIILSNVKPPRRREKRSGTLPDTPARHHRHPE